MTLINIIMNYINQKQSSIVVPPRFELGLTEPKSGVLPLHYGTIIRSVTLIATGHKIREILVTLLVLPLGLEPRTYYLEGNYSNPIELWEY